jgi:hypothetical protein
VEIGRKLVDVKDRVGQPGFEDFVTGRLGWSRRSGYNFIAVFETLAIAKFAPEDLTIYASSLYRIAAPSTPATAALADRDAYRHTHPRRASRFPPNRRQPTTKRLCLSFALGTPPPQVNGQEHSEEGGPRHPPFPSTL